MDTLNLLAGLASITGFIIQIYDIFPKYAKYRGFAIYFSLGILVGSILRAIEPSSIKLNLQITWFGISGGVMGMLFVLFLLLTTFSEQEAKKRERLAISYWLGGLFFTFFLASQSLSFKDSHDLEKADLSIPELNLLVSQSITNKDYERAIMHLHTIEKRLQSKQELPGNSDEHLDSIRAKIKQVEDLEYR